MYQIIALGTLLLMLLGILKLIEFYFSFFQPDSDKGKNINPRFVNFITNGKHLSIIVGVLLVVCLGLAPLLIQNIPFWKLFPTKKSNLDPNEIGDAFGGTIGPIVGLMGAALTYLAFYIQYKANEDQKARIDEIDTNTKIQHFESNFYNLLQNYHTILNSLKYEFTKKSNLMVMGVPQEASESDGKSEGIACLSKFANIIIEKIRANPEITNEEIINEYNSTYNKHHSILSHYLRNLYHFFLFVHNPENKFPKDEKVTFDDGENIEVSLIKYNYAKIIRAQLSSDELLILALNSKTGQGQDFEPLVREYRLLKNINLEHLSPKLQDYLTLTFPHINND